MVNILQKETCSGCHACATACPRGCIRMVSDEEGFWYPQVDAQTCVDCGLCEDICPVMNRKEETGELPQAYAAWNRNEEIRRNSSSGGVFTALAQYVIGRGGVVFGVELNDSLEAVHGYAENLEDLARFRGSKYLQSRVGNAYSQAKRFLDQGRLVMFSGTPCQTRGLQSFLRKDYDNLICQDIICHGVPSPKVWKKYLAFMEEKEGASVRTAFFRDKAKGWKKFGMRLDFENERDYQATLSEDIYLKAFLKDVCLRPSCYACAFKTLRRESDITLADFWGIQKVCPEIDDDKGLSLVIVHSEKGRKLFAQLGQALDCREVELDKAIRGNSAMLRSANINPRRAAFLEKLDSLEFDQLVKRYCPEQKFRKMVRRCYYKARAMAFAAGRFLLRRG